MSHRIVGSNFDTMSRETTSQPAASKALPTDLVPQKSFRSGLGIFKEQDHRHCDDENSHVHRTKREKKEPNFAMKLALGLDVQTNAKGGKFMSIEDSRQGALVCKADVEVLWEPGNFQDDGGRVLCEQHRPGAVDGGGGAGRHRQHDFPGAARTELESQLQRAVKVSAKGKHVKCKMDLERCLFWDPAGNRVPRPAEFARRRGRALVEARHVWLMGRQWGVLFEVRHLMLEPLEAPCCPF